MNYRVGIMFNNSYACLYFFTVHSASPWPVIRLQTALYILWLKCMLGLAFVEFEKAPDPVFASATLADAHATQ